MSVRRVWSITTTFRAGQHHPPVTTHHHDRRTTHIAPTSPGGPDQARACSVAHRPSAGYSAPVPYQPMRPLSHNIGNTHLHRVSRQHVVSNSGTRSPRPLMQDRRSQPPRFLMFIRQCVVWLRYLPSQLHPKLSGEKGDQPQRAWSLAAPRGQGAGICLPCCFWPCHTCPSLALQAGHVRWW